jgi:23S rRNA (uridine2552-2'-O)-methyltransferase
MTKPYDPQDKLMHHAYKEGFRARSVYKLKELDQKFHLIKPGQNVLDLGAAPGSWLQYTSIHVTSSGKVLGLDLKPIKKVADNVITSVCEVTNLDLVISQIKKANFQYFDLIISDLAPNTSGIAHADHIRSLKLDKSAVDLSQKFLRSGGNLIMKVFPGASLDDFIKELKENFAEVKLTKVSATRDRSSEIYIVCLGKI